MERVKELRTLVEARLSLLETEDCFDNISVFIKPEPHKRAKIDEGRLRLISAVSFVDTMVDRVLFGWLTDKILSTVGSTSVMVGWSPVYGQWRTVRARLGRNILCVDKSAWDWTVQQWVIEALRSLIERLAVNAPDWWVRVVRRRFRILFSIARFQMKDGTIIDQNEDGVMKSGCYLTIILNSFAQLLLHLVAIVHMGNPLVDLPLVVGDDTVQTADGLDVERYVLELSKLGCKPKVDLRTDVEFAGFVISSDSCVPAYGAKHLYRLEYTGVLPEYLKAMQMLYANDKAKYELFANIAMNRCPDCYLPYSQALKLMNAAPGELRAVIPGNRAVSHL